VQRTSSSTATAWTLTDGHAGNERQARALAAALGLDAIAWTLEPRAPWRWVAPRWLPGSDAAFGEAFARAIMHPPALAIGCGRQAALATRLLRARGSRAVQILDPRIASGHWDLVIAPEHDGLAGENVVTLTGSLHPVDDAWLAKARVQFPALEWPDGPQVALLVGGSSAHARFGADKFDALAAPLLAWAAHTGGRVLATASRRTPDVVRHRLREAFGRAPHRVWTNAADGPNPYAGMLARADRIVCTADSVNMLSEACATRAPVYVAGLEDLRGRPRRFVERLLELGRVRVFEAGLDGFPVTPLNETARVADAVRERLGLPVHAER
jgi:mitochondrial fission protein ELM1